MHLPSEMTESLHHLPLPVQLIVILVVCFLVGRLTRNAEERSLVLFYKGRFGVGWWTMCVVAEQQIILRYIPLSLGVKVDTYGPLGILLTVPNDQNLAEVRQGYLNNLLAQ